MQGSSARKPGKCTPSEPAIYEVGGMGVKLAVCAETLICAIALNLDEGGDGVTNLPKNISARLPGPRGVRLQGADAFGQRAAAFGRTTMWSRAVGWF